ncbi:MAG TPA: flagellin [Lautropia sp.]|nr:flagellin [Lautropia sp.]
MTISVNTNKPAMIALQALNRNSDQLTASQNRINTGLRIAGAKDNASVYAIAQAQRADISALGAVRMSLDRAGSIADVAIAAGESISDLLNEMKEKVIAAKDTSLDTLSRDAVNSNFQSILRQIQQVINNAAFDGANMLNGTITPGLSFLTDADATGAITLSAQLLALDATGSAIALLSTDNVSTVAAADLVLPKLEASMKGVNTALANLGSQAKQIEAHKGFVLKLADVLEAGVGNLVDADLAKESARLQALQVQQQLGAQALSIANQSPQIVLQLFRGG